MATRFRVLPYRQGSKSAKALADALGGKVLKLVDSKFKTKPSDVVINWGNTAPDTGNTLGYWGGTKNKAQSIRAASNKLKFFQLLKDKGVTPDFWENKNDIPEDAYPIVCRTILAGHSGAGIILADGAADLVDCSLYVKYEKKKDEYRVHCGRTPTGDVVVISVQRKARRAGLENGDVNYKVRNLANGFVYVRQGITPPASVLELAQQAIEDTSLDFGAVDVIFNEHNDKAFVLEINTAPGLEGQTVTDYANYFTGGL